MTVMIMSGTLFFIACCSVAGSLQLEVIPNHPIYELSEALTLICCNPNPVSHQIFEFYKEGSNIYSTEQNKSCASYMFIINTKQDIGPYHCVYRTLENETDRQSNMSNTITVQIADIPPAPSIFLIPSFTVYTKKESLTLTCSSPGGTAVNGIQIYREGKEINEEKSPHIKYVISASAKEAHGKYSCRYWVQINGRNISSSLSEYVIVTVIDVPADPSISLSPLHPVYIRGESVTVICSLPHEFVAGGIIFYKAGKKIHTKTVMDRSISVIATSTVTDQYSCQYWETIHGRNITSDSSNKVKINIVEIPPAPSISLKPEFPVYIKGEAITVLCSPPNNAKEIRYFKDGHVMTTDGIISTYTIPKSTQETTGKYSCLYWLMYSGRKIKSQRSLNVTVNVIEIPPAPSISLKPEFPVYIKGEAITVLCSPPNNAKEIRYFKDGHVMTTDGIISTYTIPKSTQETTGKYSCLYWLMYSGRKIKSQRSLNVTVNVIEIPQAPSIILNPVLPVYISGESINMTCSPPDGPAVISIQYYKYDKEIHESETLGRMSTYLITSSSPDSTGNYSCRYCFNHSDRYIYSQNSLSVAIRVMDIPPAPVLKNQSGHSVFLMGDSLQLLCSVPSISSQYMVTQMYIYLGNEEVKSDSPNSQLSTPYAVSNLDRSSFGVYSCQFKANVSSREIISQRSNTLKITLIDTPLAPVLQVVPNHQVYIAGETLNLQCFGSFTGRHNVYKDGQLLLNSGSPLILFSHSTDIQQNDNGNYTCTYHKDIQGRMVESLTSQPVNIYVIDPLPCPNITLESPVQKTDDGFQVTLKCSAPDVDLLRTFYYFKATEENDMRNSTDVSGSLVWELEPVSHVVFSCEYEEVLRGRKIRSIRSRSLNIPLSEASLLTPPMIAGIIGVVSLLLCLTLVIWFYVRNKRQNKNKRLRFSWYWKENKMPNKVPSSCPVNPVRSNKDTSQDLEMSRRGSINLSRLSITTEKEDNALDNTVNFSTFQRHSTFQHQSVFRDSARSSS
ncbi:immunoglobulin superfamily member 1-like [Mixophyes fleayi]|uniref:immunoglobulin superfamily member 1-like n=1 Tax=Mixophyes fleayi TaxID=3061075 RepID=UPI003F4E38B7